MSGALLTDTELAFLAQARRIVLCTTAGNGSPRPVPVCFAVAVGDGVADSGESRLYTPLDEKPKGVADPHRLARVRDIVARPAVTLLADRWDEDWDRLAWLRLEGTASLIEPGAGKIDEHSAAVRALRARYPQYSAHALESRPVIRIVVTRATFWQPE
jgi:PPOX class probable F420-dependent enzyme